MSAVSFCTARARSCQGLDIQRPATSRTFHWPLLTPTSSSIEIVNDAKNKGLLKVSRHGKAVTLRTSTEQWQPKRDSIRVISNQNYNGGLFIFDVKHMPSGCGLWPSIWMVGPNWPNGGEIDIVEGVNDMTLNAMSSHVRFFGSSFLKIDPRD